MLAHVTILVQPPCQLQHGRGMAIFLCAVVCACLPTQASHAWSAHSHTARRGHGLREAGYGDSKLLLCSVADLLGWLLDDLAGTWGLGR